MTPAIIGGILDVVYIFQWKIVTTKKWNWQRNTCHSNDFLAAIIYHRSIARDSIAHTPQTQRSCDQLVCNVNPSHHYNIVRKISNRILRIYRTVWRFGELEQVYTMQTNMLAWYFFAVTEKCKLLHLSQYKRKQEDRQQTDIWM